MPKNQGALPATVGAPHTEEIETSPDSWVSDPTIMEELDIGRMGLHRWRHDPELDFPPYFQVRGRNYTSRRTLEEFKVRMLARAIKERKAPRKRVGERVRSQA